MENQESPDPNQQPYDFWNRRRWLVRLRFSFLLIAVYLIYIVYKNPQLTEGRKILHCVGAGMAFVMFLMGTREQHRPG